MEITAVQQLFNQLLQFVQQGIGNLRFVQLIWTW